MPWQCALSHLPCSATFFVEEPNCSSSDTHSGHHFVSVREIQQHMTAFLTHVPKEHFQRSVQQWLGCWSKCLFVEGKYFESDYIKSLLPQTCLNSEDFLMLPHTSAHTQYVYSSHYLCYHIGGVAVTALIFYDAACFACETLVPLGLI